MTGQTLQVDPNPEVSIVSDELGSSFVSLQLPNDRLEEEDTVYGLPYGTVSIRLSLAEVERLAAALIRARAQVVLARIKQTVDWFMEESNGD